MIIKPALAAMLATGLIVPEKPRLVFPRPAIVKAENLEFSKPLLAMPLTMGMLTKNKGLTGISFRQFASNPNSLTTYTFNSIDIGTAQSDRYVYVYANGYSGSILSTRVVSSISIAGTNGTIVGPNPSVAYPKAAAIRNVTTGTTATIGVTFPASCTTCIIAVYAIYGVTSTTARDSDYTSTASATSLNITVGDVTAPVSGDFSIVNSGSTTDRTASYSGGSPALTDHGSSGYIDANLEIFAASAVLNSTSSQTYTVSMNSSAAFSVHAVILRGS